MAGPVKEDAGEIVTCPSCGREVKQKAMIPLKASSGDDQAVGYVCTDCARNLIQT